MDERKRRKISNATTAITFFAFVTSFLGFVFFGVFIADKSVCTFANISECEALIERAQADGTFEIYESPASDKHAKGLEYTTFFGGKYSDSECRFEIFAYEFPDRETAVTYFKRHTGKNSRIEVNYSSVIGLFGAHIIVLNGNTAYVVYTPSIYQPKTQQVLDEVFSIVVRED